MNINQDLDVKKNKCLNGADTILVRRKASIPLEIKTKRAMDKRKSLFLKEKDRKKLVSIVLPTQHSFSTKGKFIEQARNSNIHLTKIFNDYRDREETKTYPGT